MSTSAAPDAWSRYRGFESLPLQITVRVGATRLTLGRLAELREGEVLVLDRSVGAPFDLLVGDVLLGAVEPVASEQGIALKLVASELEESHAGD